MAVNKSQKRSFTFVLHFFLLILIIFTAVPQPVNSMAQDPFPETAPEDVLQAASAPAQVLGVSVGVHLRPSTDYGNLLDTYNQQVGKNSSILMWFSDWRGWTDTGKAFNAYLANKLRNDATTQPVIMITWQPQNGQKATGCNRDYGAGNFIGYNNILSGACDTYIRNYAREIAARDERFLSSTRARSCCRRPVSVRIATG